MEVITASARGTVFALRVKLADGYFARLRGLMFSKSLGDGEGLLLKPCRQIHTFFMRFEIDAVFISESGEILEIIKSIRGGRVTPYVKASRMVLELKGGAAEKTGLKPSDKIVFSKKV
ncbi:MAG: DUF192 domain-containing protein [Bacillota bacterium]|nr:DUF192 domain-containing protein [Bacillota bacterium]